MNHRKALVAVGALAVIASAGTVPAAFAHSSGSGHHPALRTTTVRLTNHQDTFQLNDVAPTGPSAGDEYFITSHVVHGQSGHTAASCSIDSSGNHGVRQCEIDFSLKHGAITTRGLTNLGKSVNLVITGGTRRYARATGFGALTPTPSGSKVVLTVVRPR